MPVFTRTKTWVSNEVLTASDLNAEFNNLLNNTIPASIEDYSSDVATMQNTSDPGGVGTESLATTLAGELQRLRFAIKRIVGGAQWYTAPVIDLGSTIGTDDIADGAITNAKRAAINKTLSTTSTGTFSTVSTSRVDVTNLTLSFTSTGKPIRIEVVHDGTVDPMELYYLRSGTQAQCRVYLMRDASDICIQTWTTTIGGATSIQTPFPPLSFEETPGVGTYTYKIQVVNGVSGSSPAISFKYAKLQAREL